ncbi:MAG TPA: TIGR02300 family protein [Alphaproteobacteria bacterium]|nr:TIGR02300 family protein [Alphaproteobacteria bacterium]
MSKPEWGTKRICLQCGEHFYDLGKDPIVCPKCGETMSVDEFLRLQAQLAGKSKRGGKGKIHDELDAIPTDDAEFEDAADDDLEMIEDASELDDDHHDMAEVMDNVEKGEE